jgi:hypothetical protein
MNKYILKVFIFCVAEQKIYTRVCVIRTRYTHRYTGTQVVERRLAQVLQLHTVTGTGTFKRTILNTVCTHT